MADRVSYGPFTLYESDAYKQAKAMEVAKKQAEFEKAMLDLEQKKQEQPIAKISQAEELSRMAEQAKQQREGIPFGDVAKEAALNQGMNLLQANKAQGEYNVNQAMLAGRQGAIENILAGGKGFLPTEKYDYQGVSGTALRGQGASQMSSTRRQIFQQDYNDFYDANIVKGMDQQQAHENAVDAAVSKQQKDAASGKVQIMLPGLGNLTTTPKELNRMMADPNTPQNVKDAIKNQWGTPGQLSAKDYLKSKLGR